MTNSNLDYWNTATGAAKWGVQQAIKTTLELAADEQIKICWGADDYNGAPCLINAINQMLSHNSDHSPMGRYPNIVGSFDRVNQEMWSRRVNKDQFVSPITAEILLKNMGELKPIPDFPPVLPTVEEFTEWAASREQGSEDALSALAEELIDPSR